MTTKTIDPEVLAKRKRIQREQARIRVRNFRAKAKAQVDSLLHASVAAMTSQKRPHTQTGDALTLPERTARAVLKKCLAVEGVTLSRVVHTISQALDSTRLTRDGSKKAYPPDFQTRLRAGDAALRLLERSGDIPSENHGEVPANITVQMVVMPQEPKLKSPVINTIEMESEN